MLIEYEVCRFVHDLLLAFLTDDDRALTLTADLLGEVHFLTYDCELGLDVTDDAAHNMTSVYTNTNVCLPFIM